MEIRYLVCLSFLGIVNTASITDVKNLHTLLFTTNSYNKNIRPTSNTSTATYVYIGFTVYGIRGIDEIEQKLTTMGWLDIQWDDELLTWTPSSYGNLDYIYVPQGDVWKPDISLQNGFSKLEELGSKFIQVLVLSDGTVSWRPFQVFESKCSLDSTYFPFDQQKCDLEFVAWSLSRSDVYIEASSNGIDLSEELKGHGEWEIVSSSSTNELETTETKVKFTIVLKRKPLFVIMNIIIPIVLLSLLSIFTFKIPADIGERMGYTITVWLSFAVFLTIVSGSLPQTSETTPIVSIYIMIQLFMGTLIVLTSSVESGLTTLGEDVPVYGILKKLVIRLRARQIKPSGEKGFDQETSEIIQPVTWKETIVTLDKCLFWICCLIFSLSTLIAFAVAATKHN